MAKTSPRLQSFTCVAGIVCAGLLIVPWRMAEAQFTFATDNAGNYGGSWTNGSDQGTGFGGWGLNAGANSGGFIGNPSNNGMGTTGIGTTAFGMFSTGSGFFNAGRGFDSAMQVGDAFTFYWAMNWDANSGSKGFDLRAGGSTIFNVNNGGSSTIGTTNGNANTAFGTDPMLVTLTRTSGSAYSFSMTSRSGNATFSTTISSSSAIDNFNLYIGNQNDGNSNRNIYFNNFQVTNSGNYSSGGTVTSGWAYTGTGALIVGNNTTLVLTNSGNTFTGGTTVNAGSTLQIGDGGSSGSLPGSVVNNGSVTFNRTGDVTYTGGMSGSGVLNKQGSGALFLNGSNSYTGSTTVSGGTLEVQHANALGTSAAGTTVASGAVLKLFNATGMTIADETLSLNGTGVDGAGGALLNTGGNNTWTGAVTLAGNSRINADNSGGNGSLTISGGITGGSNTLFAGARQSANIHLNGSISGSGAVLSDHGNVTTSIFKDGGAALTLNGSNTFSGATLLNNGTILIGNNSAFGTGTIQIHWSANNTKILASTDGTARTISNALNVYNDLNLGAGDRTGSLNFTGTVDLGNTLTDQPNRFITTADATSHSFGNLSGNRSLIKQGGGTLNLNGSTNTASGFLAIDNGVLNLGGGNIPFSAIGIGSGVDGDQDQNNATLRVTGTTAAYTPNITVNGEGTAGTRTIDFANTSGTAILSGSVTLEKAVAMTVASGGTANITGAVSGDHLITKSGAGTLRFNNTVAGPVTVTAGTLGGNATIGGMVTLNSGATLAPGNSVGTMTLNGGLTLNSGGNVTMEITNSTTFDKVIVSGGDITYGGVLYISLGGFTPAYNSTFDLFDGTRSGVTQFSSILFSDSFDGTGSTFNYDTGTLTVIPEPSTYALMGIGAAFVLWRLRRRKQG